jgi:putative copper export protein
MMTVLKMVHVLALGLWVGAMTFFSFFTALPLIRKLPENVKAPNHWLHLSTEQDGIRLAGESLEIIFDRYFPYQVACGVVALLTAFVWFNAEGWVHKLRAGLLVVAVVLAVTNWLYLAPQVSQARTARYTTDPVVKEQAEETFKRMHGYSLTADMITLLLAGISLALTVMLPGPIKEG